MKVTAIVGSIGIVAALSMSCNTVTGHKVLTVFFDGVPPPAPASPAEGSLPVVAAGTAPSRSVGYKEHGPYAARMCNACHEAAATNALLAPGEELCYRCHELRLNRKYTHGPLSSGGCLVCHDPHSSQYRNLLVSESDNFCFHCHDRRSVERIAGHDLLGEQCTRCHDAHMSNEKYLLK